MALDRESIEITLLSLENHRQLHREVNGVDIIEDVFRSRYIAAGLERIFACSSESESGIALFLILGALDYSELSQATGRLELLGLSFSELARPTGRQKEKQ